MSTETNMDTNTFTPMNIFKVMQRLPHRYPFLLIDRILDVEMPNKRLKALKNVTINEPFFPGHFPHRPVMPGVLVLEAMAQASSLLLTYPGSDDGPDTDTLYYFAGIDNARFKRPPGDLGIEINCAAYRDSLPPTDEEFAPDIYNDQAPADEGGSHSGAKPADGKTPGLKPDPERFGDEN